jgi:hypothetical protein
MLSKKDELMNIENACPDSLSNLIKSRNADVILLHLTWDVVFWGHTRGFNKSDFGGIHELLRHRKFENSKTKSNRGLQLLKVNRSMLLNADRTKTI